MLRAVLLLQDNHVDAEWLEDVVFEILEARPKARI